MRFSYPKNKRLNWVIMGKIFIFFFPNMKKYFDEIIHSKDFEKSRGYVPMLEIFNLIMNMTNRLGVKVH